VSQHHSKPGEHQRLPATAREIRKVLVAITQHARILNHENDVPPDALHPNMAAVLLGLVLGIEGTVYPVPGDEAGDLGFRVGQSLVRGGSPWV